MFEECKEFFEIRLGNSYGTYSPFDHREFEEYLKEQNLDIDHLEFDLEELIDEWIQQDRVYKDYLN
jgi:hypothetical protein